MILRWRDATTLPVEVDGLTPSAVLGVSAADIRRQPARAGNRQVELGELFEVESTDDASLTLEGNLSHVRKLGAGMTGGHLVVRGDAGPWLGSGMLGGRIDVYGRAADGAGAGLRGGLIQVFGDAGHFLGAARPGERLGMRDGVILVHGKAGDGVGQRMRRGLIALAGAAGDGLGRGLVAGSVFAFGGAGGYPGLGMKRGTIALFGPGPVDLLPTFAPTGRHRFPFLGVYLGRLRDLGFPVPAEVFSAEFARYNGDLAEGGQGEVLVPALGGAG